jgi:hypothetical protein
VACIGEGPVVHMMPLELDWGTVPVLQDKPKKILLSNESLIPARFTAHMVKQITIMLNFDSMSGLHFEFILLNMISEHRDSDPIPLQH